MGECSETPADAGQRRRTPIAFRILSNFRPLKSPFTAACLLLAHAAVARAQPEGQPPALPPKPELLPQPPPAKAEQAPDTWGSGDARAPRSPTAPSAPEAGSAADDGAERASSPPPARAPGSRGHPPAEESVRYTLENIELRGNNRVRARVVLRYLPFKPGDVLDVENPQVELARYRLLGTGFFRDVQFSLRKGSQRGKVVLIVEVVERNTIVVNDLWMGLAVDADTESDATRLGAYAGLDVAETNLAGTGITLGGALGLAREQLALRVRFLDPAFLGGRWMTTGTLLFNRAKDFFGNEDVIWQSPYELDEVPQPAIVRYKRFGGSVGVGRDLSISTQFWAHYRLESIEAQVPPVASHLRGGQREKIQFDVLPGQSVVSTVRALVQHDTRDTPFLTTRGWFLTVAGELSLAPAGSDYDYQRFEVDASRWWTLPWGKHVLRLSLFGGAISGDTPFFEQFYVNDFSDFRPGRVLGLNFDARPAPDILDTSIVEIRRGHYAGRLGLEYRIPLYRGRRSVYGIDIFGSAGIYGLASHYDLSRPPRGYSGAARIPVDLTANFGLRMDTSAGGFAFSFANALGLIPALSEEPE
jgi:outer membrane protein assembly factor BamA